jgi:hypothetical protein
MSSGRVLACREIVVSLVDLPLSRLRTGAKTLDFPTIDQLFENL